MSVRTYEVVADGCLLTCMMARTTQRPPIMPTSTHVKMLHKISPSSAVGESVVLVELEKKSVMQSAFAVLCFVAEIMIQTRATENAAVVDMMWIVV